MSANISCTLRSFDERSAKEDGTRSSVRTNVRTNALLTDFAADFKVAELMYVSDEMFIFIWMH
jgi:hypothetical protein